MSQWQNILLSRHSFTIYVLHFQREQNIYLYFMAFPHIDMTHPPLCKTRNYLFYIVNIMGVDVLTTQGGRASATVIFSMLNQISSVMHFLVPFRKCHSRLRWNYKKRLKIFNCSWLSTSELNHYKDKVICANRSILMSNNTIRCPANYISTRLRE